MSTENTRPETEQADIAVEPKKKNRLIPIILGILIIGGAIFGIYKWNYGQGHESTDDAQIDGDVSPVVARVGGYVQSINFEENTHVDSGKLLVSLDDRDLKLRVEQAEAAKQGASAGIDVNQAQVTATAANTATAKANIAAARARVELANKNLARYANLLKEEAITQQQYDQSLAETQTARATYQAAQDQYAAAVKQVGATQSQIGVTNKGVSARQADVDFAKLQLSYAKIYAPAAGIVSRKNIQVGQLVQPGQTLFTVINDGSMYITANFKETQLDKLKQGQKVDIEVDAFPKDKLTGTVYNFAPLTGAKGSLLPPDNATGNFVKVVQRVPVKIKIDANNPLLKKLRPGMSVNVVVETK